MGRTTSPNNYKGRNYDPNYHFRKRNLHLNTAPPSERYYRPDRNDNRNDRPDWQDWQDRTDRPVRYDGQRYDGTHPHSHSALPTSPISPPPPDYYNNRNNNNNNNYSTMTNKSNYSSYSNYNTDSRINSNNVNNTRSLTPVSQATPVSSPRDHYFPHNQQTASNRSNEYNNQHNDSKNELPLPPRNSNQTNDFDHHSRSTNEKLRRHDNVESRNREMQKDQEPTHKAKDEWKNVGPPPARTYVNTNNSKVTSTNEIKDKDKLKNNTKDISAATPNQYAPASQSPSTYSPTTALPQPTTVSTTTMPLMSIPKPLGSPPVPQSSTTIHQSLAKQAVSSPVAIQSSVTSAAGSPVAPPPSTNQKSLAGSPVAPPFFANQQSSVIQQTPTKQTAISSIVPSSLTTQQSSALNVVDISSNMDEYSYVTHESNVKALDSHVAHLAENQENLHVLLRLTDILKQGDKYEDLQAKFYFNEFEIQCYETILCQLHPKQDPRLQRKVIAETHKSILSADLNELKLILKGLENHPSLPPLDSFQTTDAISNPSTPNVPSHSASSGAVPEFKPSTKRKASFEEQHREKGAKIVQSQERASNTTDNQPSVGKDSTSNIHASIPEVEVKFEFESNKFPNNSATVQTHVRSSSNSLTRIPEKSTTPPVIAPPDTTKSHFYMHTVNKTQAAPHQPSIGRLATDQRRDPPDAAPQSLANSNAVGPISHSEQLYKIDSSKPSSSLQQHSVSDSTQISTSAVPAKASENELPAKPLQSSSNLDIIPDTNSNVDSQPVSTNRPPSPVPMNAVVSTELNTDRQEPTVALPAATSDKTYDTVRQELIIIREEAREQRARTDQLLTLLHNEAQQRHEAERRIAEMTVEIQDQQVKILRKDLEAKRSEALSMMYKAQAEMREASAIASEAREQRAKAMEDSARAQVEIQSLQRRIQEMEFRYHGSSKNSGNNNFMSEGAMTNVDKYGTLSAISSETLSLRQGTTHLANDLISTSSAVTTLNSSNVRSAVITAAKMELTSAVTAASITTHKEMTLDSVSSGKEDCAADVLPVVSASE